jgi:hypothetical protein
VLGSVRVLTLLRSNEKRPIWCTGHGVLQTSHQRVARTSHQKVVRTSHKTVARTFHPGYAPHLEQQDYCRTVPIGRVRHPQKPPQPTNGWKKEVERAVLRKSQRKSLPAHCLSSMNSPRRSNLQRPHWQRSHWQRPHWQRSHWQRPHCRTFNISYFVKIQTKLQTAEKVPTVCQCAERGWQWRDEHWVQLVIES